MIHSRHRVNLIAVLVILHNDHLAHLAFLLVSTFLSPPHSEPRYPSPLPSETQEGLNSAKSNKNPQNGGNTTPGGQELKHVSDFLEEILYFIPEGLCSAQVQACIFRFGLDPIFFISIDAFESSFVALSDKEIRSLIKICIAKEVNQVFFLIPSLVLLTL